MSDTRTLISAIGEIKASDYKVRFKILQSIYEVYELPFDRLTILSLFEVPVNLKFHVDEDGYYFSLDGVNYHPDTVADFVSVVRSLRRHKLTPKFSANTNKASILWNRDRKKLQ